MKKVILATGLYLICSLSIAAEKAGVFIDDEVKSTDGQTLVLNAQLDQPLSADFSVSRQALRPLWGFDPHCVILFKTLGELDGAEQHGST